MRPLMPFAWSALALVLSGCGEPGLDLRTPSDAREYVRLCALGHDDLYCEAMLPTLREVQGPVSVILPNTGDEDRLRLLTDLLAARGVTVAAFRQDAALQAAFARANIFPVQRLTTGTHRTLDGKEHRVMCGPDAGMSEGTCQMDELSGVNQLHHDPKAVGSIYATFGPTRDALPFFPF